MSDENRRIVELERMFANAQSTADRLERSARRLRRNAVIFGSCLLVFCGWTAYAGPGMKAVAVKPDPIAQLNQKMADMEKRLQHNIDSIQLRVKRLEDKPDNVDNPDENKGGGKGSSGGSESSLSRLVSDLEDKVSALENRTVIRAPFIVNDSEGHALFTVAANAGASGVRGVRIFNNSGQPEIELDAGGKNGGMITAKSSTNDSTSAELGITAKSNSPFMALKVGGNPGVAARASASGEGNVVWVYGEGNQAVAALESRKGKGLISVQNQSGTSVAFLTESDHAGGGNVTLTNPAGEGVVSGGYDGDEGSFCLDRKHHLVCLGVNLPLSIAQ